MPKQSLREQRRIAREERRRRQRLIITIVIVVVVVAIGLFAFQSIRVNNQYQAIAAATSTSAAATGTASAATLATVPTSTAAPGMAFPGVITDTVKTASGLQYKDVTVGSGTVAKDGNTVSVQYTGWLTNGTKFDSSLDHGQAFEFVLGQGNVIKGWDEGVAGMKVGGTRILVIPPDLGYGATGQGSIPANATLIFEVQLVAIK
jgi:FKBP-type peptidyl-prolyl cis-trans isomerase